jgi:chromosome partitioning protein
MIVLIGGEKGGCGKSTIATNLAVRLALDGASVCLIDADPQGTSARFAERRDERLGAEGRGRFACVQRTGDVSATARDMAKNYKICLIDAGGRDSKELRTAMAVCDLLLTPFRASQADIETLVHVDELVGLARGFNPNLQAYAVISMAPSNPVIREVREAQALLGEFQNLALAETIIRDRKVYRDALLEGCGVVEMSNGQAKAEIDLLTQEFFETTEG